MKLKLILICFISVFINHAMCQVVETLPAEGTDETDRTASELFKQVSLGFGNPVGGTTDKPSFIPPNLSVKTYKLTALFGKGEWSQWDFYILNSVPSFTINRSDSLQAFSNDLLQQVGGIANVSLAKTAYFFYGSDSSNKDIKGLQFEFRAGGKFVDTKVSVPNKFPLIPLFQTSLDLRYMIPLVSPNKRKANASDLRRNLIGNLSFRVFGTYMKAGNKRAYDYLTMDERGNPSGTDIVTAGVEVNIFFTNSFFITGGYTYVYDKVNRIPDKISFGISYMGGKSKNSP